MIISAYQARKLASGDAAALAMSRIAMRIHDAASPNGDGESRTSILVAGPLDVEVQIELERQGYEVERPPGENVTRISWEDA